MHNFVCKLCSRYFLPNFVPGLMDWMALKDLPGQDLRQLSSRDFLHRLKLKPDLDAACRIHVQEENSEKKPSPTKMEAIVEAAREEFVVKAQNYFVFLLEAFLADISLNDHLVRRLNSFDSLVLFAYTSIRLRFASQH